ncbi:MAG: IS110 family transposase [Rhodanobacteraceae bacterium]
MAAGPVYAVDLAKNVFQVHTFGPHGERRNRQRLSRRKFADKFTDPQTPRGTIVMEACGSANYWGRRFAELGYRIQLVPPQFVAQRRMGNKTGGNDADTIYAVYGDRRVKPVPLKTLAQQDLAALHCIRERLVNQRTQCRNQVRGLLAERGVVEKAGDAGFSALLQRLNQADEAQVSDALRYAVATVVEQIDQLQAHIRRIEAQLKTAHKASPVSQLLATTFGVGLITATACAAEYGGSVARFADSRQFAANIGITPGEHSSGEKQRRGSITKRGNPYLRKLLVQGANAVVNLRNRRDDALCLLARRLFAAHKQRATVIVAIANRMARIVYAILKHREPYRPQGRYPAAQAA